MNQNPSERSDARAVSISPCFSQWAWEKSVGFALKKKMALLTDAMVIENGDRDKPAQGEAVDQRIAVRKGMSICSF